MDSWTYKKGDRVRHPRCPDWGVGEVREDARDDKLPVFFENAGLKTLSLSHVEPEPVTGADAESVLLDNLHVPDHANPEAFRSLPEMRQDFLVMFPQAFADPKFLEEERSYKDRAIQTAAELLSESQLSEASEAEAWDDIKSRALQLINQTNLINPYEKMALANGVEDPARERRFGLALQSLLYGDEDFGVRFDAFAAALEEAGAAKWTLATYFTALRFPEEHIFVKPIPTKSAAEAAHFEIHYRSQPNSSTYAAVQRFAQHLWNQLSDWGPNDMVDIQSFMFRAGPKL